MEPQLYKASSARYLGVRESSQALAELKTKLEFALSRLNDQDTLRTGIEEIKEFLQTLYADWFPMVLSCIAEAGTNLKPLGRCESVKLMGLLAEIRGEAVVPLLPRILQVVVVRLQDADLHLREACAETVFRLTQALVVGAESSTTFATLLKPLFGALGEHNKWVQIGSAACICSVIQGAPSVVIKEHLGRLCSRLVQHLGLPLAMAKPQLLNACIYLMQAVEGADFDEALPALMPCLENCLNATSEWQTRRQAIEVLQAIGDNGELGQTLDLSPTATPNGRPTALQKRIAMILEPAKVDKVRQVREAVKEVLLGWGISRPTPTHAASAGGWSSTPTGANSGGASATWPDRESLLRMPPGGCGGGRSSSPLHGSSHHGSFEREPSNKFPEPPLPSSRGNSEAPTMTPTATGSGLRQRSIKAERDSDAARNREDGLDGRNDHAHERAARGAAVKAALSGQVLNSTKKARPKKERQSIFDGPANANFFRQGPGGDGNDEDEDVDMVYDNDGSTSTVVTERVSLTGATGRSNALSTGSFGDDSASAHSSLAHISVGEGLEEPSAENNSTPHRPEDEPAPSAADRREAQPVTGLEDGRRADPAGGEPWGTLPAQQPQQQQQSKGPQQLQPQQPQPQQQQQQQQQHATQPLLQQSQQQPQQPLQQPPQHQLQQQQQQQQPQRPRHQPVQSSLRTMGPRALSEDSRSFPVAHDSARGLSGAGHSSSVARSRRRPDLTRQRQEQSPDPMPDREWQWDRPSADAGSSAPPKTAATRSNWQPRNHQQQQANEALSMELLELRKQIAVLMEDRQVAEKLMQERLLKIEATCERQSEILGEQHRCLELQGKQLQLAEVQLKTQEQMLQQQDGRLRKQEQQMQEYEVRLSQQQQLLEQQDQLLKDSARSDEVTQQPPQQGPLEDGSAPTPAVRHVPRSSLQVMTDGGGHASLSSVTTTSGTSVGRLTTWGSSTSSDSGLLRDAAKPTKLQASPPTSKAPPASKGMLWESVVALCDEHRFLEAYKQVIAEPEESCLLKLMQHTGPVVDKLDAESNSRLVRRLIHILSSPAKEPLTVSAECIFSWLRQALDVGIHFTTSQVEDLAAALQKVSSPNSPLPAADRADAQRLQLRVAALRRG